MRADIGQPSANVLHHLIVVVHKQPLAETEAAVGPADIVDQQEGRVAVLVFEAGNLGVEFLV